MNFLALRVCICQQSANQRKDVAVMANIKWPGSLAVLLSFHIVRFMQWARHKKAKKQFRIRLGFAIQNTIKSQVLTSNASRSTSKLHLCSNLTCCWLTPLFWVGLCRWCLRYSNKLWYSQLWTQFLQLRMEAWKVQDFSGVTSRNLWVDCLFQSPDYQAESG